MWYSEILKTRPILKDRIEANALLSKEISLKEKRYGSVKMKKNKSTNRYLCNNTAQVLTRPNWSNKSLKFYPTYTQGKKDRFWVDIDRGLKEATI